MEPFDELLTDDVLYLLLHVEDSTLHESGSQDFYRAAVDRMAGTTGFQIDYRTINLEPRMSRRFILSLPSAEHNGFQALKVAQTIVYCQWAMSGPLIMIDDPFFVLPIPPYCVDGERIQLSALKTFITGALGNSEGNVFIHTQLLLTGSSSAFRSAAAWRLASVAFGDQRLERAIRHLVDSQMDFYAYPGEIPELLGHAKYSGYRWWEWTRLERALISAYSAVEALVGDPPRKVSKLRRKLRFKHHIDPDRKFGELLHLKGLTVAQMVHSMQRARDEKAAHGSTADGSLTLAELLEYQSLARYLVLVHAEHSLGEPLYQPGFVEE